MGKDRRKHLKNAKKSLSLTLEGKVARLDSSFINIFCKA
jgi:hypothetical protein